MSGESSTKTVLETVTISDILLPTATSEDLVNLTSSSIIDSELPLTIHEVTYVQPETHKFIFPVVAKAHPVPRTFSDDFLTTSSSGSGFTPSYTHDKLLSGSGLPQYLSQTRHGIDFEPPPEDFQAIPFSGSGSGSEDLVLSKTLSVPMETSFHFQQIFHFQQPQTAQFETDSFMPSHVIQDRQPMLAPVQFPFQPIQSLSTKSFEALSPSLIGENELLFQLPVQEPSPIDLTPYLHRINASELLHSYGGELVNDNTTLGQFSTAFYDPTTNTLGSTLRNASKLCGFPGFCSVEAHKTCAGTVLSNCDECSMSGAALFASVAIFLGVLILLGNAIVIRSALTKNKKDKDFFSKIKCSLALADMLTGIEILCVIMYNFSWAVNSTAKEIDHRQLQLRGSTQAVVGGIFYLLGFTSSLYHLVFLGGQRLYAIWRPVKYKLQPTRVVYIGLAAVWAFALVTATIPLWIPDVFTFSYIHTNFIYYVAISDIEPTPKRFAEAMAIPVVTILVPFIFMTFFTGVTAFLAKGRIRQSRRLQGNQGRLRNNNTETDLFKTVACMQIGFTVTLIPVLVATLLSYTDRLTCDNVSLPYLICFYISMSNSLVNVVVYSARDAGFRSTLREMFCIKLRLSSKSSRTQTTRVCRQKESGKTTLPV